MRNTFFKEGRGKSSEYPADFIPAGGKAFVCVDKGSPGGDCTARGFYKDGEYHVQSVDYTAAPKCSDYDEECSDVSNPGKCMVGDELCGPADGYCPMLFNQI